MRKVKFVVDSTAAFTAAEVEELGLEIVPLSIHMAGEVRDEGLPSTYDEYYTNLAASKEIPTTSQPSVGRFQEVFERALADGYEVIAMLFSSELSGTYHSAQMAAGILNDSRVTVIDTRTAVANYRLLVRMAREAANRGETAAQIREMVENLPRTMFAVLTVDDLVYLKRGGRLNNSQYFIGKLLNILPIIMLRDGKLYPHAKCKGSKALLNAFRDIAPDNTRGITVCHIQNEERAAELKRELNARFPQIEIDIQPISPVIGSHLGPGAYGYCYYY